MQEEILTPDDIKAVATLAISHRIILKPEHQIKGLEPSEVVQTILRKYCSYCLKP